jgi:hypothetical protein
MIIVIVPQLIDDIYNSRSGKFIIRNLGHNNFDFISCDGENFTQRVEKYIEKLLPLTVLYIAGHISQQYFSRCFNIVESVRHNLHGFICFDLITSNNKRFLALFGPDPAAVSATHGCRQIIEDLQSALYVADVLCITENFPHSVNLDLQVVDKLKEIKRTEILQILEQPILTNMPFNDITIDRVKTLIYQCGIVFATTLMTNTVFSHRIPLASFWKNVQFIIEKSLQNLLLNDTFIRKMSDINFFPIFQQFNNDYGNVITLRLFTKHTFGIKIDDNFIETVAKIYTEVGDDLERIFSVSNGSILFQNFVQRVGTIKSLEFFSNKVFLKNIVKTNTLSELEYYAENFGYDIAVSLFSSPTFMTLCSNRTAINTLISVIYNGEEDSIQIISSLLKSSFAKILISNQDNAVNLLQQCIQIFGLTGITCIVRNNIFFTRCSVDGVNFLNICRSLVASVGKETSAALMSCYCFCKHIGLEDFTLFCNRLYMMLDQNLIYTVNLLAENCFTSRVYPVSKLDFNQLFNKFKNKHGVEKTVTVFSNGSFCARWYYKSFRDIFDMFLENFGVERTVNAFRSQAFVCCFNFKVYNFEEMNRITQNRFKQVMTLMKNPPLESETFCGKCLTVEDIESFLLKTNYEDNIRIPVFVELKRCLLKNCPNKFIRELQFTNKLKKRKFNG